MRIPDYLSPTGLKTFEKDKEQYYIKYLADDRPPRTPQTSPMAIGSSFDAFVKSYLHHALFGNYGKDNEYEINTIFEAQVQPHERDTAFDDGKYVFQKYQHCGALADIMAELSTSISDPRFEFEIKGFIETKLGKVPLLGKPDIFFINNQGARVILDWKVNGYFSNSRISPKKGYIKCRDTWGGTEAKASRNNGLAHRDAVVGNWKGLTINLVQGLEETDVGWADQLSIYGWMLGEEVGSEDLIFGIDQIVCKKRDNARPLIRVANHRCKISSAYQFLLYDRIDYAWSCIVGQFFDGTPEESEAKCNELDKMAAALSADDPLSNFINRISSGW